ncbi:uncharacterized protein CEXT_310231 [Caerostris extrusa]|uniref:Uncharacterized protein n=1 Tax=Caerostris extrusa TaxID=172846 RepID=A0AAV4TIV6_CAEEX|nr:uncharacterized protein CEXT_310231 [Caerostris extrusa]
MRRAAKNDTRGTIFRLITILWSHLHEEKHVGSLIAKSRCGQSRLSTVHQRRYGGWTGSTIGAGRRNFFVCVLNSQFLYCWYCWNRVLKSSSGKILHG